MKKIWLVTHESCVDGEHLYKVIPCFDKDCAFRIMKQERDLLLDECPIYATAREWMSGKHDEDMDNCPYEWSESESDFFIKISYDAYAEHIEVKEEDVRFQSYTIRELINKRRK